VNGPVGLECDSWLNDGRVDIPDGKTEKLSVGNGRVPVKDGTVKEESARLLREPVNDGSGTLLCEIDECDTCEWDEWVNVPVKEECE
jgi:hypothetical protein